MKKQAVLFDIDGTLIDSWDFVFGAVKFALDKHGHSISEEVVISAMGGRSLLDFCWGLLVTDPGIVYKPLLPEPILVNFLR